MDLPAARTNMPRVPVLGIVTAAILVILALAALLLVAGSQRRVPPPFGLARNGVIVTDNNGDVMLADADGANLRTVVTGPEQDEGPQFTRDGSKFIFNRVFANQDDQVMIANADGGSVRPLVDHRLTNVWSYDFSPNSDRVVIAHEQDARNVLSIVSVDDPTSLKTIVPDGTENDDYESPLWRPPDGKEILFVADPVGADAASLFAMRPDGTGVHPVGRAYASGDSYHGLSLTPDGTKAVYWNVETSDARPDGWAAIHVLDLVTGKDAEVQFREDPGNESSWSLSPDGTQLLSSRWLDPGGHVQQLQIRAFDRKSPPRDLGPSFPGGGSESAMFSPDGREVVLSITRDQQPTFIDVATGATRQAPSPFYAGSWQRQAP